jgi:hypothetical protein
MLIAPPSEVYDDGLIYNEYDSHTQHQMEVVRRYLDVLNEEMRGSTYSRRTFVQLFAEPGLYRNRETQEWFTGAALHALSLTGFNRYFYSSLNQQVLATLEQRAQTLFPRPDAEVHFMGGNCNDLARGIIGETEFYMSALCPKPVHKEGFALVTPRILHPVPAALTFCIYQSDVHLRWETVSAISRLPYVNMVLYYPLDALNRQMAQAQGQRGETDVDGFFGGKAWRDLYRRGMGQQHHEQLLSYYCERLKALGFGEVRTELDSSIRAATLGSDASGHLLIFAHKQPKSAEFWQSVLA